MAATTFAAFCEEQYPRLVGVLRLHVRDDHLAQELAQEAMARACRDWEKVSQVDAPAAWVYRVGFNLANSHYRRRAVYRRIRQRLEADGVDHSDADTAEDRLLVRAALARLRPRARQALILRYYADLAVDEVARLMGCPASTVKTLTRRGLSQLRAQPEFAAAAKGTP